MPVVRIVASLAEARTALAEGATRLDSPRGAAGHHGIGWWRELLRIVQAESGAVASVLDCADCPGQALAAIRDGIPCVRLDAPPEVFAKVKAIASAAGCELIPPEAG